MSRRKDLLRLFSISRFGIAAIHGFRKLKRLPANDIKKRQELAEHFIDSLIALGPTFVKLGQILSTRPEMVPAGEIVYLAVSFYKDSVWSFEE